jgi:hypothetical protein
MLDAADPAHERALIKMQSPVACAKPDAEARRLGSCF